MYSQFDDKDDDDEGGVKVVGAAAGVGVATLAVGTGVVKEVEE